MPVINVKYIYIVHYKKLIERKNYLQEFFKKNNIDNFEFRDLFQRENLTNEISEKYFKLKNLSSAQICITIEHIETYKNIVYNTNASDDDWFLILEDDAIFCNNFIDKLNKHLDSIPKDAEYLDISDYMSIASLGITSQDMWVKTKYTRTNVSYLIKKKTCSKLLTTIIPFDVSIDHELNKQFALHDIKVYWSNISLVHHGSDTTYGSSYVQYCNL
jgi:GR25 family glycosyltransferase involved in LPS biosynthesis